MKKNIKLLIVIILVVCTLVSCKSNTITKEDMLNEFKLYTYEINSSVYNNKLNHEIDKKQAINKVQVSNISVDYIQEKVVRDNLLIEGKITTFGKVETKVKKVLKDNILTIEGNRTINTNSNIDGVDVNYKSSFIIKQGVTTFNGKLYKYDDDIKVKENVELSNTTHAKPKVTEYKYFIDSNTYTSVGKDDKGEVVELIQHIVNNNDIYSLYYYDLSENYNSNYNDYFSTNYYTITRVKTTYTDETIEKVDIKSFTDGIVFLDDLGVL